MRRLIESVYIKRYGWLHYAPGRTKPTATMGPCVGVLWNWRAAWVGVHHSKEAKRTCVNLVPFLTVWYTKPGGMLP